MGPTLYRAFAALVSFAAMLLVASCSTPVGDSPGDGCGVAGTVQRCPCAGGGDSTQICLDDGAWGACDCLTDTGGASDTDGPDAGDRDVATLDSGDPTDPDAGTEGCNPLLEVQTCLRICEGPECEGDESAENPYDEDPEFETVLDLGGSDGSRLAYGRVTGDYRGVLAYSNYMPCDASPGCWYGVGDGRYVGDYGYQFQCVEYVVRFFDQALGYGGLNGNGNAKTWWTGPKLTTGQSLLRFANGSDTPPQPGDAIVFDSSGVGHIAIIREVGSDYVRIIQQNWSHTSADGNHRLAMTVEEGTYTIHRLGATSYPVLGWLRAPIGCRPDAYYGCSDGDVYRYDSCGNRGARFEDCSETEACAVSGQSAACVSACPSGDGFYCGESVERTAGVLYRCVDGLFTASETCSNGCQVMAATENDQCRPSEGCVLNDHQDCSGDDVYWYDSCGVRGGLIDACSSSEICRDDGATAHCESTCTNNDHQDCFNGDVFWFDSCGVRGSRADDCSAAEICQDDGDTAHCQSTCTNNDHQDCFNGDVFWFDSCDVRGTLVEDCSATESCVDGGATAHCESTCADNDHQDCSSGDVYWYDSCGVRGARVAECTTNEACQDEGATAHCVTVSCPSGDGLYCGGGAAGGETGNLYMCSGGALTLSAVCAAGCQVNAPGTDDSCTAGSCPSGNGLYCGEPIGQPSDTLFNCVSGVYTLSQTCSGACVVAAPGHNDSCP